MKKQMLVTLFTGISALLLLNGCIVAGNRVPNANRCGTTLGQELLDLQKAKDAGILTDAEFQAERAKLLKCR